MWISAAGTLAIIISALIRIDEADCFSFIRCGINPGRSKLCHLTRRYSGMMVHSKEGVDDIVDRQFTPCPTSPDDCQVEQWAKLCDDVDMNMEGLVSPAPQSFYALHSIVSGINHKKESLEGNVLEGSNYSSYLDDLQALSSFLVKPGYTIKLYLDYDQIKWKLLRRSYNKANVIHPFGLVRELDAELHHRHNTLQLSRMALELATKTPGDSELLTKVHFIAQQAEKRLVLTMGLDLRGPTSSDACFNFALAGVQCSSSLFQTLSCIGIHELKRTGLRASFQPKHILHMVEKFAASDIHGQCSLELYHIAAVCLEKKGYSDHMLIESLKIGGYGFHFHRPLMWLWRYSSRQRKVSVPDSTSMPRVDWANVFHDTTKPLVVDVGSGMGGSLLNLSVLGSGGGIKDNPSTDDDDVDVNALNIHWSECNYAGADLNQAMVNFGNGIISRDPRRQGRAHFFCLSAEDFLQELMFYPGGVALIMINFPTPYSIGNAGNSQLPSKISNQFMVTAVVLGMIAELLSIPVRTGSNGLFLFQTKCEDVAVHVVKESNSMGLLECVPCNHPVKDIDLQYEKIGKRPKRVDDWLQCAPSSERAEGNTYSSAPLLPRGGIPETEAQCNYDKILVHRCLFCRTSS